MIGRSAMRLMRRHSSKPSIPGIITSTTTSAGQERSRAARAIWPEAAVRTSKPSRVRRRARTESSVGSSSTSSTAGRSAGSMSNADALQDRNDGRSENHDEDRGKDAADHGEEHLDRGLGGCFLGTLAPLDAQLVRLDLEHFGDRNAELLGLDDGTDEVVDGLRVGALGHVTQCLSPRPTHADLGERLAEFLDQRPVHLLDDLGQRGVEAKARLDRNRQQVESVWELQDHRLATCPDPAAEPELRPHEADTRADEGKEESPRDTTQQEPEQESKDGESNRCEQLDTHPVSPAQAT